MAIRSRSVGRRLVGPQWCWWELGPSRPASLRLMLHAPKTMWFSGLRRRMLMEAKPIVIFPSTLRTSIMLPLRRHRRIWTVRRGEVPSVLMRAVFGSGLRRNRSSSSSAWRPAQRSQPVTLTGTGQTSAFTAPLVSSRNARETLVFPVHSLPTRAEQPEVTTSEDHCRKSWTRTNSCCRRQFERE
jgi:hypothetical protein